jgi:hypothetical protein
MRTRKRGGLRSIQKAASQTLKHAYETSLLAIPRGVIYAFFLSIKKKITRKYQSIQTLCMWMATLQKGRVFPYQELPHLVENIYQVIMECLRKNRIVTITKWMPVCLKAMEWREGLPADDAARFLTLYDHLDDPGTFKKLLLQLGYSEVSVAPIHQLLITWQQEEDAEYFQRVEANRKIYRGGTMDVKIRVTDFTEMIPVALTTLERYKGEMRLSESTVKRILYLLHKLFLEDMALLEPTLFGNENGLKEKILRLMNDYFLVMANVWCGVSVPVDYVKARINELLDMVDEVMEEQRVRPPTSDYLIHIVRVMSWLDTKSKFEVSKDPKWTNEKNKKDEIIDKKINLLPLNILSLREGGTRKRFRKTGIKKKGAYF